MLHEQVNNQTRTVEIPGPVGVRIEQTSTRGNGTVELGQSFRRDDIDFSGVEDHLSIHTGGRVAGSQFSGDLFREPRDIIDLAQASLPDDLQFDQHNRAELTIAIEGGILGFSGVKSLEELKATDGVRLERGMRIPDGEVAEVDGIKGAWYPETSRNPKTGKFEVVTNPDGSVKNSHGKFEPQAWIATVDEERADEAMTTDKMTVIVQQNPQTGLPTVLTIFPGENAPAFPAKIESEAFQADNLQGPEATYWDEHAFVKT